MAQQIIYVCDRCKAVLAESDPPLTDVLISEAQAGGLCQPCFVAFQAWWGEGSE